MHLNVARGLRLGWLVGTVWLGFASGAVAQSESLDAEAHSLFEAGRTAFADGRFDDALPYFEHAYELSHRPQLLYNIGQCHDRMRHDAEALAAFERFLAAVPDSREASEVRARVAFLRTALATTTTTSTETETASTSSTSISTTDAITEPTSAEPEAMVSTSTSNDPGAGPWALIGVGAALAVGGAVLTGVGYADISSVENAAEGSTYESLRDAYDQAPIMTGVGFAALGVGAALALGGVIWIVVTPSGTRDEHAAALRIGTDGISVSGTF